MVKLQIWDLHNIKFTKFQSQKSHHKKNDSEILFYHRKNDKNYNYYTANC